MGYDEIGFTGHVQRAVKSDHILENFSYGVRRNFGIFLERLECVVERKLLTTIEENVSQEVVEWIKIAVSLIPSSTRLTERFFERRKVALRTNSLRARLERIGAAERAANLLQTVNWSGKVGQTRLPI